MIATNADIAFSRPAIWYPDMDKEEWQEEVDQMLSVAIGLHLFNTNQILYEDLEDILNENNLDPISSVENWVDGVYYS